MSFFFTGRPGGRGIVFGDSSDRIPSLVLGYPFSLVCWFFPTNTVESQHLVGVGVDAGNWHSLRLNANENGDPVQATSNGLSASITFSTRFNQWNVAAASFEGQSSRYISLNGSTRTQNTSFTSQNPVYTRLGIGDSSEYLQENVYTPRPFYGHIAHVTVYNCVLDNVDCALFGAGASPMVVRPKNIVAYFPLVNPGRQRNLATASGRANVYVPYGRTNGTYSNWNPPVQTVLPTRPKYFLPSFFTPVTNKLRSQIAFLKPYTGILPIADG